MMDNDDTTAPTVNLGLLFTGNPGAERQLKGCQERLNQPSPTGKRWKNLPPHPLSPKIRKKCLFPYITLKVQKGP